MENIYTRTQTRKVQLLQKVKQAVAHFTKTEWYIFLTLLVILGVSTFGLLSKVNQHFLVEIPMRGGSISEGIIGVPRFVNPVLANTDADKDLVALIYGGLMRKDMDKGIIPDLAEKVEMSKNGLTYTFTLKDEIYFHDGTKVTADDVVFTVGLVEDAAIKSPLKANWEGITVQKVDDKTVTFTLKRPYASFLENATLGILPKHLWQDTSVELSDLNTNPVGTGSYKIKKIGTQTGSEENYYELEAFKKFALGEPYIDTITLKFYQNEDELIQALKDKEVDQISSISPEHTRTLTEKDYRVISSVLPRIFGLFFNQNQNQIFTDKNVIRAIDLSIDKDAIVKEVLAGYGISINGPIPPTMLEYQQVTGETVSQEEKVAQAAALLAKDGWKKNADGFLTKTATDKGKTATEVLQFSISTGNAPELATAANLIKKDLEKVGIQVEIKTFDIGNLNQIVIRPRKYDALLFGQIINSESDLFAFWHSSQRKDPGLNVAMYTNSKVDSILEDAFITVDRANRIKKYGQFQEEIQKDMPAVFLYSPEFIYIISKTIKNLSIDRTVSPHDRFSNAYLWYTRTDSVWKIFTKQ